AMRNLSERPLLILGFARPEVREVFPNLWAEREYLEVRLSKLSPRSCERLLGALAGTTLDAATRSWLVERAEGNPFFLEELVRSEKTRQDDRRLPDSILGIVQARLDALGEDAKLLIRAGSVFGQSFRLEGLKALLGGQAARLDLPLKLQLL